MSNFINECNEVTFDIRKKTETIKVEDIQYLLKIYGLDKIKLKTELIKNTEKGRKFLVSLTERTFGKVNTMTYATVVRYFMKTYKLNYTMYIGFACLQKDKPMYEKMNKDLSSHPFPVNHIFITIKDGDENPTFECFVSKDKRYYVDVCHADYVVAESNN